jgi:hypothetical protein
VELARRCPTRPLPRGRPPLPQPGGKHSGTGVPYLLLPQTTAAKRKPDRYTRDATPAPARGVTRAALRAGNTTLVLARKRVQGSDGSAVVVPLRVPRVIFEEGAGCLGHRCEALTVRRKRSSSSSTAYRPTHHRRSLAGVTRSIVRVVSCSTIRGRSRWRVRTAHRRRGASLPISARPRSRRRCRSGNVERCVDRAGQVTVRFSAARPALPDPEHLGACQPRRSGGPSGRAVRDVVCRRSSTDGAPLREMRRR